MVLRSSIVSLSLSTPSPSPVLATHPREAVSAAASRHVCLLRLCLCVCLPPRLLVVGRPGRPPQIKEHKGDCCGSSCSGVQPLSVCVCLCVCMSCPGRADGPSSHGAGSSCVLCCRSGSPSPIGAQHSTRPRSDLLFYFSAVTVPPPPHQTRVSTLCLAHPSTSFFFSAPGTPS